MALTENPTLVQIVDEIERLNNLVVDRGGTRTITPSTYNQILSKGNYKGDITILGDNDLLAENIKKGVNIFGVNGAFEGGTKWAEGTSYASSRKYFNNLVGSSTSYSYISIGNLGFKPRCVICVSPGTSEEWVSLLYSTALPTNSSEDKCINIFKRAKNSVMNNVPSIRIDQNVLLSNNSYDIPVFSQGDYMWIAYG